MGIRVLKAETGVYDAKRGAFVPGRSLAANPTDYFKRKAERLSDWFHKEMYKLDRARAHSTDAYAKKQRDRVYADYDRKKAALQKEYDLARQREPGSGLLEGVGSLANPRKPTFGELMDSLTVLCRAEKAAPMFCEWVARAVGSYEDAETYLPQIAARTDNSVIRMLAKQALQAR